MAKATPHPKPTKPRHYIREWRKYRHLTLEQVAERIGKTHGALSQLERGITDYSQGMLEALAYALRCEPGDLLSVNPLVEGKVVDISDLLRGAPPYIQEQAYALIGTLVQTGTRGPMEFYHQPEDADEGSQPNGPKVQKESVVHKLR